MERARQDLEALQAQVEKDELKEPDRIGTAAATKLRRSHGHRYFDWEPRQGKVFMANTPCVRGLGEPGSRFRQRVRERADATDYRCERVLCAVKEA